MSVGSTFAEVADEHAFCLGSGEKLRIEVWVPVNGPYRASGYGDPGFEGSTKGQSTFEVGSIVQHAEGGAAGILEGADPGCVIEGLLGSAPLEIEGPLRVATAMVKELRAHRAGTAVPWVALEVQHQFLGQRLQDGGVVFEHHPVCGLKVPGFLLLPKSRGETRKDVGEAHTQATVPWAWVPLVCSAACPGARPPLLFGK